MGDFDNGIGKFVPIIKSHEILFWRHDSKNNIEEFFCLDKNSKFYSDKNVSRYITIDEFSSSFRRVREEYGPFKPSTREPVIKHYSKIPFSNSGMTNTMGI